MGCGTRLLLLAAFLVAVLVVVTVSYPSLLKGMLARASSLSLSAAAAPAVATPASSSSSDLRGSPTVSVPFIDQVLAHYHSPASDQGQVLSDLGVKHHIDPVFALAFFMHESSFGTAGVARSSHSLGNLRCIPTALCSGGYAYFLSWQAGFEAWYALIAGPVYFGSGLYTVEKIIPKYAPAADHNDEAAYIASVEHAVSTWRAGRVEVR